MDIRAVVLSVVVALFFVGANVLTKRSCAPGEGHLMVWVSLLAISAFFGFRLVCQTYGLGLTSAVIDSVLTLLTVAWAVFILRERYSTVQYVGLILLLVGLLLVNGPWSGGGAEAESPEETPESVSAPKKG